MGVGFVRAMAMARVRVRVRMREVATLLWQVHLAPTLNLALTLTL